MDSFDLVVVGAGPSGYVCAIRAAQLGLRVALIEKQATLGGTCLNVGCIPSKALLESSELFFAAGHALAAHGVMASGVALDLERMMARKQGIVRELTQGLALLMRKNKVTVVAGVGTLLGPGQVEVSGERGEAGRTRLEGRAICLAMGSMPLALPHLPFDGQHIVTSTEALAFSSVPRHLVVVGAGAVGLELGSVWRRLGAEVTVVEMLPRIAPFADAQMATMLQKSLAGQGLRFRLGSQVTAATVDPDGEVRVVVTGEASGGAATSRAIGGATSGEATAATETLSCDRLLVAVGRRPASDSAGLAEAGVELDVAGRVKVDDRYQTNLPGVHAIGDLIVGPMLAHKAEEEGIALAEQLAGKPGHVDYDAIPAVVYTDPELACVGQTEEQLKQQGTPYKAGKFYFRANGRARSLAAEEGMAKVLAHAETDRLLGVHIVGARASEMIAEAVLAMEFAGSAEDIARTCHAHPTLSEILKEAALAVERRAIHG